MLVIAKDTQANYVDKMTQSTNFVDHFISVTCKKTRLKVICNKNRYKSDESIIIDYYRQSIIIELTTFDFHRLLSARTRDKTVRQIEVLPFIKDSDISLWRSQIKLIF